MFGKYAAYIVPAYAISALVIAAMAIWIRLAYRKRLDELAKLEAQGIRRASQEKRS